MESGNRIKQILKSTAQLAVVIYSAAVLLFCVRNALHMQFSGDNFFMFAHGRVLFSQGFVSNDPLSMHGNYSFVMPQWLYAAVIWLLKCSLGNNAVFAFQFGIFILTGFMFYKNACLFNDDRDSAFFWSAMCSLWFFISFVSVRPYFVTTLIGLSEINILERYFKDGKKERLLWLPLLSVIQINAHNSLWIVLILVILCYIAEAFVTAVKDHKVESLKMMLVSAVLVVLAGFINPYGFRYIKYIFDSLPALKSFYSIVGELTPSFRALEFWLMAGADIAVLVLLFFKSGRLLPLRHLLLMGGFGIMASAAIRNNILWFSLGQTGLLYAASFLKPVFDGPSGKRNGFIMRALFGTVLTAAMLFMVFRKEVPDHPEESIFTACDRFAEEEPDKNVKIFCTFNNGAYLEYLGYHPFIDSRAELFGKEVNGVEDLASVYVEMYYEAGLEEFEKFLQENGFSWLVLENTGWTGEMARTAIGCEQVYSDEWGEVYKKVYWRMPDLSKIFN